MSLEDHVVRVFILSQAEARSQITEDEFLLGMLADGVDDDGVNSLLILFALIAHDVFLEMVRNFFKLKHLQCFNGEPCSWHALIYF